MFFLNFLRILNGKFQLSVVYKQKVFQIFWMGKFASTLNKLHTSICKLPFFKYISWKSAKLITRPWFGLWIFILLTKKDSRLFRCLCSNALDEFHLSIDFIAATVKLAQTTKDSALALHLQMYLSSLLCYYAKLIWKLASLKRR